MKSRNFATYHYQKKNLNYIYIEREREWKKQILYLNY